VIGADCICRSKLPYTTNDMESPFPVDIKHTEYTNCMIYIVDRNIIRATRSEP
jgi:hypothetical protein